MAESKPRDHQLDKCDKLVSEFASRASKVLTTRSHWTATDIQADHVKALAQLVREVFEAQARVNTMLSYAIDELEAKREQGQD